VAIETRVITRWKAALTPEDRHRLVLRVSAVRDSEDDDEDLLRPVREVMQARGTSDLPRYQRVERRLQEEWQR